jgi:hypothetical protein
MEIVTGCGGGSWKGVVEDGTALGHLHVEITPNFQNNGN